MADAVWAVWGPKPEKWKSIPGIPCDFCPGDDISPPTCVWVCSKHLVAGRRWLKLQSIRTALPQCQP